MRYFADEDGYVLVSECVSSKKEDCCTLTEISYSDLPEELRSEIEKRRIIEGDNK